MNVWQYLENRAERRLKLQLARIQHPRPCRIDARGWVGIGVYVMAVMVIWMMAVFPELRADEFFKTIATLIIGTAFVNGVVSWAYSATKAGGELADRNASLVERQATQQQGPSGDPGDPVHTVDETKGKK